MKKKITALFLAFSLLVGTAVISSAATSDFGSGAEVVASGIDMIKTGLVGRSISFTDGDFKSALCLADFDSLTITRIPKSSEGTLMLNGRRVSEGKTVSRRDLAGLRFIPASDKVRECSFAFTVSGFASVGEIECSLKLIDRINYAPKSDGAASESSARTQENVSVWGYMSASDPEGDEIRYTVISYPEHGILSVADGESGRFCYTPDKDFTGSDKFVYVARDSYGNYTYPITVKLRVSERMTPTEYADMSERPEYNAALAMTAMNVMNGRLLGDGVYFMPDEEVSRAEFLAMAIKCAGIRPEPTDTATFFDDDGDIPVALRGYVGAAVKLGVAGGDFNGEKLLLSPNASITKYEAAKVLCELMGAEISEEDGEYADTSVPVWARSCVGAMLTLGIFDRADADSAEENLTRADLASYLYRMTVLI